MISKRGHHYEKYLNEPTRESAVIGRLGKQEVIVSAVNGQPGANRLNGSHIHCITAAWYMQTDLYGSLMMMIMMTVSGIDMKFLRRALHLAHTAVYSLHKTSTRNVSKPRTPRRRFIYQYAFISAANLIILRHLLYSITNKPAALLVNNLLNVCCKFIVLFLII